MLAYLVHLFTFVGFITSLPAIQILLLTEGLLFVSTSTKAKIKKIMDILGIELWSNLCIVKSHCHSVLLATDVVAACVKSKLTYKGASFFLVSVPCG